MSDDEGHSDADEKHTEAERALKKRRDAQRQVSHGLDEAAKELLETNKKDREKMADEINELRGRHASRKKEREQLEKRLAAQRAADEERRKAVEEEKRKKKEEEEQNRQKARAQKQAEFDKLTDTGRRNFVISAGGSSSRHGEDAPEEEVVKKSKEQLDAEKKAILKQRIQPLEISGFDKHKLEDKAKELHKLLNRLEGEKYDLEKRFRDQQRDMMELAERARQANKVGRGGLKRVQRGTDEGIDTIQERFAGTPAKIEMFSKYERQKDKRSYKERLKVHSGPRYLYPAVRIKAKRIVKWGEEDGMPHYEDLAEGAGEESHGHAAHAEEE